ncbi:hypothetical protein BKG89_06650 [Rodentibacter caecimuris]|uniref:Thiol:disulfide interchange protein DsbA n=1 Tax=Rodentibacter caecimuris TaxID=1796644 RepID=A0ABX3KWV0_9PAST|nr:hypothetical protein BKG89_06650 [Rodentibacter heylii]
MCLCLYLFSLSTAGKSIGTEVSNSRSFPSLQSELPSLYSTKFSEGQDYFAYQEPLNIPQRPDKKILIQFFFDYDCRVCSAAQDILLFYSQIKHNKVIFEQYPVATPDNDFSATIFYLFNSLNVPELSQALLFETEEKSHYTALSSIDRIRRWSSEHGVNVKEFDRVLRSAEVKEDVKNAVALTEEYGVFTFPYVVIGGKYVLTASTLYNDDYSMAVLDFLIDKIEQEQN